MGSAEGRIAAAEAEAVRPVTALGIVVLICLIGVLARLILDPIMMDRATFIFVVPPVVIGATYGGRAVGLVALVFGTISGLVMETWAGPLTAGSVVAAITYAAIMLPLALGGSSLRRIRAREVAIAAELVRREAHLSSILHTVPDAMIVIDQSGIIRDFSPTAELQFGWTVQEVIGRDVGMLMPEKDRDEHFGELRRFLRMGDRRGGPVSRKVQGLRKDGSVFPVELAIGELQLPEGHFYTGFVRDITKRQADETQLQDLQMELAHVGRLTALGEMATAIAHELNQPLSAIGNYLLGSKALLRRTEVPHARIAEAVDLAAREALRAGEIIRRMREFVSRGVTDHYVENLQQLIRETAALALVEAKDRGVETQWRLDPQLLWVRVNKVQVQQVLVNLIRNAIDAMRDSPTRLLTIVTAVSADGMAQVCIQDTGPGIDPRLQDSLFTPFVTTKQSGLGVGLSICRTIIEAHGGTVGASTNDSGGATFHFTIPLSGEEDDG